MSTAEAMQLDLFGDADAAAAAARQLLRDQAPRIFADPAAHGYFARLAAADTWVRLHGHFDWLRRSHAWNPEYTYRPEQPTGQCRPTTLAADLRCGCPTQGCSCVGDLMYRGACLSCTWEGEIRDDHNPAVEDAHDHAWPGWDSLPIAPRRPEPGHTPNHSSAMGHWVDQVDAMYPSGWLESGGPIRTARQAMGTRHVPNHTGFGGYDLCGEIREPQP